MNDPSGNRIHADPHQRVLSSLPNLFYRWKVIWIVKMYKVNHIFVCYLITPVKTNYFFQWHNNRDKLIGLENKTKILYKSVIKKKNLL